MNVIVMSDTHVMSPNKKLPDKLLEDLAAADLILHAGDIATADFLEELRRYAPVQAVYGNVDEVELKRVLPRRTVLEVMGRPLGLVHGDVGPGGAVVNAKAAFKDGAVDVVIFGHSHMPYRDYVGETLFFNPGSPTDRRLSPKFAYGRLVLREDGRLTAGHVFLLRLP